VDNETICGLGNSKNQIFLKLLKQDGVHVFNDTIDKIKIWREKGLKTAVISSSKNCKAILETAGIEHLFDTRVDGIVSEKLKIPGKPSPDIFLYAAKQLQASPFNSAIFEDAIAGVQAGKDGNFKFVVGVARHGTGEDLYDNGANLVIHNFNEL
jgi:trehalose 6-phosphate phosphatase